MSDGKSRQHHYTTNSVTIPYVLNGNSRDRVGAGGESRKENFSSRGFLIHCNVRF